MEAETGNKSKGFSKRLLIGDRRQSRPAEETKAWAHPLGRAQALSITLLRLTESVLISEISG
jgi:hypothetical protein